MSPGPGHGEHRRELHVHRDRLLGSYDEGEDAVLETFLRAWGRREAFEGDALFRAFKTDGLRVVDGRISEITTFGPDHRDRAPRHPSPVEGGQSSPTIARTPSTRLGPNAPSPR